MENSVYLSKEAVNAIMVLRDKEEYQHECSIIIDACCTLLRLIDFADKGFTIEDLKDDLTTIGVLIVSYKNIVEALANEDYNLKK